MSQKKHGRGSVSRCLRYYEKYETDPEFRQRVLEGGRLRNKARKKKINKRCVDCGKLISPNSTRCKRCSIRNNYNKYLQKIYK